MVSRELAVGLLVGLLLVLPSVAAHGGIPDGHPNAPTPAPSQPDLAPPTQGYTGPGSVPYLSFFQGAWLYGQSSATPLGPQIPRAIKGSGDWLAWEDAASGRVFAYNVPAGAGYFVGNASTIQRNPAISGTTLVWEENRPRQTAQIMSYDLATGQLRQVSRGPGNHRNPSIDGTLVAWEDDRNGTTDIWGYDFSNDTEFPVYQSPDKDQDPLVVGDQVFFRSFRFNVWDVRGVDLAPEGNGTFEVTADPEIQGPPFSDGHGVYFLDQYLQLAWTLARYDPQTGRAAETTIHLQDAAPTPVSGDHLLQVSRDDAYSQLVVRNLTTSTATHVSGNLALVGTPFLQDRTAFFAVHTTNGTSLVALDVSPFAFGRPPSLTVTSPGALYPWVRPVAVQGILSTGPGWSEPVTFTYQVDGGAPVAIPPAESWHATLDNAEQAPGNHVVTFRATFREGPPVSASIALQVPLPAANVDVEKAGEQFHSARVLGAVNDFVLANPAAYVLLVAGLALLVLVLVRVWLALRRSRARYVIEYVPPED